MPRQYKRRNRRKPMLVHKAAGTIHPRVQAVGPEHFGVISIDCAKARSKWMLCDFYGNVLENPTVVAHDKPQLNAAIARAQQVIDGHHLKDVLVAVERTGRYHRPIQQAFTLAGFDTRIVHPFATKQFRQPADPGLKTDDRDLAAIHRCAVSGFALAEAPEEESWRTLKLLVRYRRDLVRKSSALCCQIREHLEAALPGYAACFEKLWTTSGPLQLLRHVSCVQELRQASEAKLKRILDQHGFRCQERILKRIVAWPEDAADGDLAAESHRQIAVALDNDRLQKTQEIQALERMIASRLARTPYILLLSIVGVNVVSAAEFAGEMGPMHHYPNSRCITGRAGLYPSRYQSDEVDRPNGPLVRCANRSLRAAILGVADNLLKCNRHFRIRAAAWKEAGKDPRGIHVRVGMRFCRMAYQMVGGQQVCRHPAMKDHSWVLQKLLDFHRLHATPADQLLEDLQATIEQLPHKTHRDEAMTLTKTLDKIQTGRRSGPQLIGEVLVQVLARLGAKRVQLRKSGVAGPR